MSQNEDETKAPEENPATETEVGATQPEGGETNPFTTDLKGEFTSSFGTETNTVSQLLSDGAFGAKKNKIMMAAAAAVLVIAVGFLAMSGGDNSEVDEFGNSDDIALSDDGDVTEDDSDLDADTDDTEDLLTDGIEVEEAEIDSEEAVEEEVAEEKAVEEEERLAAEAEEKRNAELGESGESLASVDGEDSGEMTEDGMEVGEEGADPALATSAESTEGLGAEAAPANLFPASGSSRSYDETSEYAEFTWEGSGPVRVVFSRNPSMQPVEKWATVSSGSYRLRHPWPGTWYWQVVNAAGASEIHTFNVEPAVRRNVALNNPGGALSNGGMVSWTGDSKVARYKVEFSASGWARPDYKFQTSGTEMQVQGVSAGQYQMRVGAFSEVSGRWEYTQPVDVTVQ